MVVVMRARSFIEAENRPCWCNVCPWLEPKPLSDHIRALCVCIPWVSPSLTNCASHARFKLADCVCCRYPAVVRLLSNILHLCSTLKQSNPHNQTIPTLNSTQHCTIPPSFGISKSKGARQREIAGDRVGKKFQTVVTRASTSSRLALGVREAAEAGLRRWTEWEWRVWAGAQRRASGRETRPRRARARPSTVWPGTPNATPEPSSINRPLLSTGTRPHQRRHSPQHISFLPALEQPPIRFHTPHRSQNSIRLPSARLGQPRQSDSIFQMQHSEAVYLSPISSSRDTN